MSTYCETVDNRGKVVEWNVQMGPVVKYHSRIDLLGTCIASLFLLIQISPGFYQRFEGLQYATHT